MSDLVDRINERLKVVGLTANAASLQATGSPSTIANIINGRSKHPRTDTIEKLAAVLKCNPLWLMSGEGGPEVDFASARSEIRDAGFGLGPVGQLPKDVPVLGTAAGAELGKGAFSFTSEVVDYVRRPFGLLGDKDVYALYVEGESMVPKYEPGDLVFVHPGRKPRGGDYVVVQEHDHNNGGPRGYIKRLVTITGKFIKTEQFNPKAAIDFAIRPGVVVHKVLTEGELYGI